MFALHLSHTLVNIFPFTHAHMQKMSTHMPVAMCVACLNCDVKTLKLNLFQHDLVSVSSLRARGF